MGMHGFARLDDRIDELTRRVEILEACSLGMAIKDGLSNAPE